MSKLEAVFMKLQRAEERATSLSNTITAFCRAHPVSLQAQLREGRLGVNLVCQMQGLVVPLTEWSIELGEVVYSLRSALDNLIYACAQSQSDPPPRPGDLKFPIIQDAKLYPKAIRSIGPQLPKNVRELLEKIQPYQRSNPAVEGSPEHDPLTLLNWISNHDKHRMPVPFLIPPSEIEFSQTCKFASEADAGENVPPDVVVHIDPLSDGATVLEYRTKNPVSEAVGKLTITAQVAFETHAGMREISQALRQLTWYTRVVVSEFEKVTC